MPTPGYGPDAWALAWISVVSQSQAGTVTAAEKDYLSLLKRQTSDRAIIAAIDKAMAL